VGAEHLLLRVLLDAVGARIPVRDVPGGRQHVDRIVRDALDQHPEALFALAQRVLRGTLVRHVARDLREPDELA
jgi:hypothetical protein